MLYKKTKILSIILLLRFTVDIKTGPILSPSDDINMHLSIRPDEGVIVRNALITQSWGPEERHGGCPIQYGQRFEILILAETNQFKVRESFMCVCVHIVIVLIYFICLGCC